MKQKNTRKALLAVLSLLLLLAVAAGGTLAVLAAATGSVTNVFTPGEVTCLVEETLKGATKSNVKITNTGSVDAYIRAAIIVNWADAGGNVYGGAAPAAGTDYTISLNTNDWFQDAATGYYYHKASVAPAASTENLIDSCRAAAAAAPPDGYSLQVTVLAEAVQARGVTGGSIAAAANVWPVTVGENGTLSAKTT